MSIKYTHLELDTDIDCLAGFYTPQKEVRLKYNGREVLYVVGRAVIESSCCGVGNWGYVLVPGYIVNWQTERNDAGQAISEVEPVADEASKNNLRETIRKAESISQIEFW